MERVEKLKKVVEAMRFKLKKIDKKLEEKNTPKIARIKLEYERKDLLNSIKNIDIYIKKLELIEKVKKYENNSRNS